MYHSFLFRRCIHPYIAEMFGSCLLRIRGADKPWPTLILEHCPYTLADVVRSPSYQPLGQMNARGVSQWMAPTEYACQMASALGFLHENGLTIQPDFNENTVLVRYIFTCAKMERASVKNFKRFYKLNFYYILLV